MTERLTRSRFLRGALGTAAALALLPRAARAGRLATAPRLAQIAVRNGGRGYAGDGRFLATVSPGVPGQGTAVVSFRLDRAATVRIDALRGALLRRPVVWTAVEQLGPGRHELAWTPGSATPVGAYALRLTVESEAGSRRVYGGRRPASPRQLEAPVVRVLGVEAACRRRSYAPGELVQLTVLADAAVLTLQVLRCGAEQEYTDRSDEMKGVPVAAPVTIDWRRSAGTQRPLRLLAGDWPTGLYAVRLTTDDGRLGFAPFVLRPRRLGAARQAAVLPTNTWQAYNFYDADGDGFGDTWYAGGDPPVVLTRPYLQRGVPPRFRRYDLPFLRWLIEEGKAPDVICDDDLGAFASGDDLRRLYDLVVFPGHTEYVTEHVYDVVQRFRDLGGRLIFLSANNFFAKVVQDGDELHRIGLWRHLGRPEAGLIGAQYRANDEGSHQGPYYVTSVALAPWLWDGTGLADGSTVGAGVGGYGIEIDATAPSSPPGTQVLALIPNLLGPGVNAEMTYYETAAGARVFAAGALDFGGSVTFLPMRRMLENLWARMTS